MSVFISGFTFLRKIASMDYPVVEAISSILPMVDEFIVNIGPDEDGTLELIESINDRKIKIIRSQWNPHLKHGGFVLAQQANIALFNCTGKWAFYLQADEIVHEDDLAILKEYTERYADDDDVEAISLREINFWIDYRTIMNVYPYKGRRRAWIVKPHRFVLSRGDAANFSVHPSYKEKGRKIRAIDSEARLFHYWWVKSARGTQEKYDGLKNLFTEKRFGTGIDVYGFPQQFLARYNGSHPNVIAERIKNHSFWLDWHSASWRRQLSWDERKTLLRTWLVEHLTHRYHGSHSIHFIKKR
jgi:glycosyltransferase involved in cell wall biosynthesis